MIVSGIFSDLHNFHHIRLEKDYRNRGTEHKQAEESQTEKIPVKQSHSDGVLKGIPKAQSKAAIEFGHVSQSVLFLKRHWLYI